MTVEKLDSGMIKIHPVDGSSFWFPLHPILALHLAEFCDPVDAEKIQRLVTEAAQ